MSVQYGQVSRGQAVAAGLTGARIRHLLESGRWEVLAPSVYGVPGHRPSWRQRLWTAHLHAGPESVISHESAARLDGFEQVRAGLVVLTVPDRRRHHPDGVTWHRLVDLDPSDVTDLEGLPVTMAARTVVDVASRLHVASLRLMVEQGAAERMFTLPQVGTVLGRVRRRGKPGIRRLSQVLDDLGPGDGVPRSELERLLDRVIEIAGLPAPLHEHALPNERGRPGVRGPVLARGRSSSSRATGGNGTTGSSRP